MHKSSSNQLHMPLAVFTRRASLMIEILDSFLILLTMGCSDLNAFLKEKDKLTGSTSSRKGVKGNSWPLE